MRGHDLDRPLVILIVAEPEMQRALEQLLAPTCQVISFRLPAEAIDAIDDETAAVVLDIDPEGHDNLQVFEEILKKSRHLPVIVQAAYQAPREMPDPVSSRHRPFAYFVRGAEPRVLLDIIDRALLYSRAIMGIKQLVLKVQGVQGSMHKSKVREP